MSKKYTEQPPPEQPPEAPPAHPIPINGTWLIATLIVFAALYWFKRRGE